MLFQQGCEPYYLNGSYFQLTCHSLNEPMGEIKLGLLGNFTIIDEKYEVLETLVNGETVYKK